jgi:hypothetical protein
MPISDSRLMQNIRDLQDCLTTIQALTPKRVFDTTMKRESVALLAQDAQPKVPELVSAAADGFQRLEYELLTVFLVGAVKDLATQIEALQSAGGAT